jgi:hypothetical protein
MPLAGHNECFDVLMDRHLRVIRKRLDSDPEQDRGEGCIAVLLPEGRA